MRDGGLFLFLGAPIASVTGERSQGVTFRHWQLTVASPDGELWETWV